MRTPCGALSPGRAGNAVGAMGRGGKGQGKGKRRQELRAQLESAREAFAEPGRRRTPSIVVGFDFDCTLTIRHFYKVLAWGYGQGNEDVHPHCEAFFEFCRARDVVPKQRGAPDHEDPMVTAVEDFCRHAGEDVFREVFRSVFLGGESRIKLLANWLRRMHESCVDFAIVTAGVSSTVMRALTAVPEWLPYFPSNRVYDCSQGRHSLPFRQFAAQKVMILRDICPTAKRIILVDDALMRDLPEKWVLEATGVDIFTDLPYEGPGVDAKFLKDIETALFT